MDDTRRQSDHGLYNQQRRFEDRITEVEKRSLETYYQVERIKSHIESEKGTRNRVADAYEQRFQRIEDRFQRIEDRLLRMEKVVYVSSGLIGLLQVIVIGIVANKLT